MSLPEKLDDWFVDKFQKFSNWFRNETGKTCYWLARQFAVGSMASFGLCVHLTIGFQGINLLNLLFSLFITNMCLKLRSFIAFTRTLDAQAERSEAAAMSPFRPFAKIGWGRVMYMPMLVMMVMVTVTAGPEARTPDNYAFNAGFVLFWFGLYFVACTPQPRKPKKVKAAAPAFHALPQGA